MDRRAFVTGLGAVLAAPLAAEAQRSSVPRVDYLGNSSSSLEPELVDAFRQGLREFGYTEGQNISIEYRWAEGRYERFPGLVADLIRLKVDVIVTAGTPGTLAAKKPRRRSPLLWRSPAMPWALGSWPAWRAPAGTSRARPRLSRNLKESD